MIRRLFLIAILVVAATCFAQQGGGNACTPAGTWYGGSVVSYQMTIVPAGPAGHYIITAQGMYKNAALNTTYSGELVKVGNKYEGSMMQLSTPDTDFLNAPPIWKLPNVFAGWSTMELVDCNTLKNVIPFFGIYFASSVWSINPGEPLAWTNLKTPLVDAPDVDLVNVLGGGHPIIESYHRLGTAVNPALLHTN